MLSLLAFSTLFGLAISTDLTAAKIVVNCSDLTAKFPGKVEMPGSDAYIANKNSYFSAFENDVSPSCFIRATTTEDVAAIVKYARSCSSHVQLAVRAGGHTAWAGSANIQGGITIDLSNLTANTPIVDNVKGLATIGTGARWGNVYNTLGAQGLTVVGARVSGVGVGGSSLGGGLSYFSEERGFVCDNIVNYKVVLASGDIVNANQNTNQDLFVALKGGSGNFGIVTEIQTPIFQLSIFWGGFIYYNNTAYPDLIQAFHNFSTTSPRDKYASIILATTWIAGIGEVAATNLYYSQPVINPPSLAPFVNIQPQLTEPAPTLRLDSLVGFTNEQENFLTLGARQWYFTTSFRPDVQLMADIRALWLTEVAKLSAVEGLMFSLVYEPITEPIITSSLAKGTNLLGLKPSDGPLVICLLDTIHANATDDALVSSTALDLVQKIDALTASRSLGINYRFLNYGYQTQKILESYGLANVKKMKQVSAKYDPTGFFQTAVPGGFKVSRVLL
ncbi:hypothetical protein ACMFMG_005736 [Clarireedia jacksonii]